MIEIIILNGTPSSGKSSIARALQDRLTDPFLIIGIDLMAATLPARYLQPPLGDEVLAIRYEDGEPIAVPGTIGNRLVSSLHHSVAALVETGERVIVDHALIERAWTQQCAELFRGHRVLFVGVHCPLPVLEQRERQRPDRRAGTARAQLKAVHADKAYDVEVDTSMADPDECAERILEHIEDAEPSLLFRVNCQP